MILVDRPIWPAHGRLFAHLISDHSFEELHAFARRLRLPHRAFHHDHYDLPESWWQQAIDLGAVEVDARVLARRLRASGLRVPPAARRASLVDRTIRLTGSVPRRAPMVVETDPARHDQDIRTFDQENP